MKMILKVLVLSTMIITLWSCEKQITQYYYNGGTAPVLKTDSTDLHLSYTDSSKNAFTLTWTNPNYQFTTGSSSQNVNYNIEVDSVGDNFKNPVIISVSNDLSQTFTQGKINSIMANSLNLSPGISHQIEIRIISSLSTNAVPLISNTLEMTATPYAPPPVITPPTSGTLFIVGSAVAGGWNNPIDNAHLAGQQFTKLSSTLYEIILPLNAGGEYKFIGVNGSWNQQWSIAKADDPTEIYGGPFVFNGANTLAPPTNGNYKIDVDFQHGVFTVTKQ